MSFDWGTFWFVVIIGVLVLAFVLALLWFISLSKKRRKQVPSHIELYFDSNFRKIMDEWDFTTRDRVKSFKKEITKRLSVVDSDISNLEKKKKDLEKRLTSVEKEMGKLEGV
ncbi:MAG TPA: hypothetical protein ENK47_00920 [Euryarchaeota archaeon]|nr:MAG: hypothetical protein B6U90_05230 [Thermoplasmatales archaeon ex4484_6]HHD15251.1 hypothetical protein [Euryarchaeota archaeon]